MSILEGTQRDIVERFESLGSETITVIPAMAKSGPVRRYLPDAHHRGRRHLADPRTAVGQAAAPESADRRRSRHEPQQRVHRAGHDRRLRGHVNYGVAAAVHQPRGRGSEQKVAVLGSKVAEDLFGNAPRSTARSRSVPCRSGSSGSWRRGEHRVPQRGPAGDRAGDHGDEPPVRQPARALRALHLRAGGRPTGGTPRTRSTRASPAAQHQRPAVSRRLPDLQPGGAAQQLGEVTTIFSIVLYSIAASAGRGIASPTSCGFRHRADRRSACAWRWGPALGHPVAVPDRGGHHQPAGGVRRGIGYMMTDSWRRHAVIETYTARGDRLRPGDGHPDRHPVRIYPRSRVAARPVEPCGTSDRQRPSNDPSRAAFIWLLRVGHGPEGLGVSVPVEDVRWTRRCDFAGFHACRAEGAI